MCAAVVFSLFLFFCCASDSTFHISCTLDDHTRRHTRSILYRVVTTPLMRGCLPLPASYPLRALLLCSVTRTYTEKQHGHVCEHLVKSASTSRGLRALSLHLFFVLVKSSHCPQAALTALVLGEGRGEAMMMLLLLYRRRCPVSFSSSRRRADAKTNSHMCTPTETQMLRTPRKYCEGLCAGTDLCVCVCDERLAMPNACRPLRGKGARGDRDEERRCVGLLPRFLTSAAAWPFPLFFCCSLCSCCWGLPFFSVLF